MAAHEAEVLIIDDESIVCERLKEFLESKSLYVETFTDSEKAIERLNEKQFDVVVTDYKMAGKTGMDVLLSVKENSPETQVIMITAYATIEKIRGAETVGVFEFINKPFKMSSMYKLITRAAKITRKLR